MTYETLLKAPKELIEAQKLAHLSDTAIKLPFFNIELGLDFIVGLIPVIGDTIMVLLSARIIWLARKLGMPKTLQLIMIKNCLTDYLLGLIPLLGDIIDLFYKANKANAKIIQTWWLEQNKHALNAGVNQSLSAWDAENS